ncbi:hypothetical protein CEXT_559871 [Caerostris extrusa]|uniref:Uncharacterized protein n=1 Tax=Caerostris extrusa TaxID=172846 RepID=A0AAV4NW89_CAEEX|nr:hypothetical protein CEXT_559871 [Caerostris extrusa]
MSSLLELMSGIRIDNKNLGNFPIHSKDPPLDSIKCKGLLISVLPFSNDRGGLHPSCPPPPPYSDRRQSQTPTFLFLEMLPLHQLAHPPIDPGLPSIQKLVSRMRTSP